MMPSGTPECAEIRQALGVYVVGAIDPAERSVVDRHLATCSACRDELAGLAGLPALLGRVTLDEAERGPSGVATGEAPPALLLDSMLTELAKRRRARRRRSVLLAVAASVAVLAGGAAGAAAAVSDVSGTTAHHVVAAAWTRVSASDAATKVTASVKYRQQSWGTEMNVWVAGVPTGTRCQLWVIDTSGRRMAAGGWQAPANDQGVWYPGSAPVSAENIRDFQITAHGKNLITVAS
jgi:anti-sigma factor RsiW